MATEAETEVESSEPSTAFTLDVDKRAGEHAAQGDRVLAARRRSPSC